MSKHKAEHKEWILPSMKLMREMTLNKQPLQVQSTSDGFPKALMNLCRSLVIEGTFWQYVVFLPLMGENKLKHR